MKAGGTGGRARAQLTRSAVLVLLVGLVATAVLSALAYVINSRNETRLLTLQAKETGTVLQVILPTIQTPLASAAELATSNAGSPADFTTYMSSFLAPKGPFVSASLWRIDGNTASMITTFGEAPLLTANSAPAQTFITDAAKGPALGVTGPIGTSQLRLGYAFASTDKSPTYVAYAESSLPPGRRVSVQSGSAFSDLRFALYLGKSSRPEALLETNLATLPVSGRTATVTVPFGANSLTLVASPSTQLGGTLSGWLWWIVAAVGVVLSVAAALMADRVVRRRHAAERLTAEVQKLLSAQRTIAESLQRALLPQQIPTITGIDVSVRYVPGVTGVEIGGDWYDIVALDKDRFFFVVGDVSGRGVAAGAVMASLRFATRGFVAEGHPPARILDTLAGLLNVRADGHFATVLCGIADVGRREITLSNAGHLPPLLIGGGKAEYLSTEVGTPIGIAQPAGYASVTVSMPPGATLLAYTDGLVERPGENLDAGLGRLRDSALATDDTLDRALDTILADLADESYTDDTAILGMRWQL